MVDLDAGIHGTIERALSATWVNTDAEAETVREQDCEGIGMAAGLIAFFRDRYVPLEEATVSIATHALNYGTGCFEGLRAYYNDEEHRSYIFRMAEHYERLLDSCHILRIAVPYSVDDLCAITLEVMRRNQLEEDVYIRPLAFKAEPLIKVTLEGIEDAFGLFVMPFGEYLPLQGIRVVTSSWRRIDDNAIPARAKVTGSYVNTALAVSDAHAAGFDDCIFLNSDGHVSEGSAANLFMVRDGQLITPPITDNLLEGITRESLMALAVDHGLAVSERHIDRSELYVADEVFLAGTGVQVVPVVEIDNRLVAGGNEGPITKMLKSAYLLAARGNDPAHRTWVTPVA